jgi:hypothetical protein
MIADVPINLRPICHACHCKEHGKDDLSAIRDEEAWRTRYNCATFEEYCQERWDYEKKHVYRLIGAASFAEKVSHGTLKVPSAERHIRPLLERLQTDRGFTDDDRIAVWRDVLATMNGAKIKAADVDRAISASRR